MVSCTMDLMLIVFPIIKEKQNVKPYTTHKTIVLHYFNSTGNGFLFSSLVAEKGVGEKWG